MAFVASFVLESGMAISFPTWGKSQRRKKRNTASTAIFGARGAG
jgi:hypothetical protein